MEKQRKEVTDNQKKAVWNPTPQEHLQQELMDHISTCVRNTVAAAIRVKHILTKMEKPDMQGDPGDPTRDECAASQLGRRNYRGNREEPPAGENGANKEGDDELDSGLSDGTHMIDKYLIIFVPISNHENGPLVCQYCV